ncbi:MAG: hypothetical protein ACI9CE_002634, partial [Flavobacterium sp.]
VIFVSWDCIKYRHKVGEPPPILANRLAGKILENG